MSTLALNGSCELQMPSSFVDIDRGEMEYVDGGWSVIKTVYNRSGINSLNLAAAGYGLATLVSIFGAVLTGATGIGLAAFGVAASYTGYLTTKCVEAANSAEYYYKRYRKYDMCLSGIGPLITGVSVQQSA